MDHTKTLNSLIHDVEDLVAALGREQTPEIQELQRRVQDVVDAIEEQRSSATERIRRYAVSIDRYITGYPRLGFLTGVLVGGLIVHTAGLLSTKR